MNKSFWAVLVIMLGVASIFLITFFQTITNTDEHNSQLLKEVTEAAMWDALDYSGYRASGTIKINREKFVENFIRRYGESANKSRNYKIEFFDISEVPPKVSVRVSSFSGKGQATTVLNGETDQGFDIRNRIDAILETPY